LKATEPTARESTALPEDAAVLQAYIDLINSVGDQVDPRLILATGFLCFAAETWRITYVTSD